MIQRKNQTYFSYFPISLFTVTIIGCFWLCQCKNETSKEYLQLFGKQNITLLDSAQAAAAVQEDKMEHFFAKVTPLDMMLQLREPLPVTMPRDSMLRRYRQFLAEDVLPFTEADAALLKRIFAAIQNDCRKLAPHLFPPNLRLLKTRGRYYGNGAFYTRENTIVIPANELETPDEKTLRAVLIHEVFHIYSRLHPEKRNALYQLIGFQRLEGDLQLPSSVQSRLLLNPDGIDMAYAIRLAQAPGDTLRAVPMLTANAPTYLPARESYFEYLQFNLYPIEPQADGSYKLLTTPEGSSPLRVNEQRDFFRQITDNTLYIIHPDEILADNFKFLVLAQSGEAADNLARFSQEGQQLLQRMKVILQQQ